MLLSIFTYIYSLVCPRVNRHIKCQWFDGLARGLKRVFTLELVSGDLVKALDVNALIWSSSLYQDVPDALLLRTGFK